MLRRRPRAVPRRPAGEASELAGSESVLVVDDANFFDETAGRYTVVDFWAPWCSPCRAFAPVFLDVARAHTGEVRFGACNVDQNPKTVSLLVVRSTPTLVVFGPDGSEVGRHVGVLSQRALEELASRLEAA